MSVINGNDCSLAVDYAETAITAIKPVSMALQVVVGTKCIQIAA